MTILRLDGVTVAYRRTTIFDRLSHEFLWGCHLIQGDNGTGKSTLLRAIAGGVPYKGRILINGHDMARQGVAARHALAYVPDSSAFYPFVTGREFVDFVLHTHRRGRASDQPRYEELVGRLNVGEYMNSTFGEASLGTRKKFFVLAALLLKTDLLVMDEPFNGLDHATSLELIAILNESSLDRTILLTCHNLSIVDKIRGARWRLGQAPHVSMQRDMPVYASI